MRSRSLAFLGALSLTIVACGGSDRVDDSSADTTSPPTEPTTVVETADTAVPTTDSGDVAPTTVADSIPEDVCADVVLEATDVGVTPDTITIEAMADVGSQFAPGLAQGSLDAVEAWVDYMNTKGGLACRELVLETYDSKIDPNEVRNGYTKGCQDAFAMVGTFALGIADITAATECTDMAGNQTGLPEIAAVHQGALQACNPVSFSVSGLGGPCPPVEGVAEYTVSTAIGEYLSSVLPQGAHGMYLLPTTSPGLTASQMPGFRVMQEQFGLTADLESGARGTDTQSHFTPMTTAMKEAGSEFVYSVPSFQSFLSLHEEAMIQGVDTVELWMCSSTCYDPAFLEQGGDAVNGVSVQISTIPYEEADQVAEMQTFVDNVQTRNNFAMSSWIASLLFEQAVNDVVALHGPNGLTRANLLEALAAIEDFDANGLTGPSTPSDRTPSECLIILEVLDGEYVRKFPTEPGTLECYDTTTITIDPATAFQG